MKIKVSFRQMCNVLICLLFLFVGIIFILPGSAFSFEIEQKSLQKSFINPFWQKRFGNKIFQIFPQKKLKPKTRVLSEQTATSYEDFKIILIRALRNKNLQISINFSPYININLFDQWNNEFWEELEIEIPWLFLSWIQGEYTYWYMGNKVTKVTYSITYPYNDDKEIQLERDLISKVSDIISPDMDMITREKTIHDWIVTHASYDLSALDGNNPLAYTDYGAFEDGLAVCEGYSLLANRMLYMAGIDNIVISGNAGGGLHAWNMIKLLNDWYHLDVTWDDPLGDTPDYIRYKYFNLSDEEISQDHFWDRNKYPNALKNYNENEYIGVIEHNCSIFEPELCDTEIKCIRISGNWCNGQCQLSSCANQSPVIDSFFAGPTEGDAPLKVLFICTAHDPDGNIASFKWDFDGDGNYDKITDSGSTTHTYDEAGVYHPKCTVVDNDGAYVSSDVKTITVNTPVCDLAHLNLCTTEYECTQAGGYWYNGQCQATPCVNQEYSNRIQEIYIAYYGRPADPDGLDYWCNQLEEAGGNLDEIIDAFGNSEEFDRRYGGLTNEELVITIYQQMFNRNPDPEGLEFYTNKLNSGEYNLQSITLNVLDGAMGSDFTKIQNKLEAANYFTEKIRLGFSYPSETFGKKYLELVDDTSASVTDVKNRLDRYFNGDTSAFEF